MTFLAEDGEIYVKKETKQREGQREREGGSVAALSCICARAIFVRVFALVCSSDMCRGYGFVVLFWCVQEMSPGVFPSIQEYYAYYLCFQPPVPRIVQAVAKRDLR